MKRWRHNQMTDVKQSTAERLRNFPREPDMLVYALRACVALILRLWLRCYHRLEIVGAERLLRDDSFVIVANHSSHLDTLCLLAALPLGKLHCAFPAAAADYFFQSGPRLWIASVVTNAMPFARGTRARQSLSVCRHLLEIPGNVLIIFPEGTRSTNGAIGGFKPGIGALLSARDVDVIPCFIDGAFGAWPKGKRIARPHKVRLIIGSPQRYGTEDSGRENFATIASRIRETICELKEQNDTRRTHDAELGRHRAVLPVLASGKVDR